MLWRVAAERLSSNFDHDDVTVTCLVVCAGKVMKGVKHRWESQIHVISFVSRTYVMMMSIHIFFINFWFFMDLKNFHIDMENHLIKELLNQSGKFAN